jgi:hypothetical protein
MKTSLFNSILCASLLLFAVACGKDSGGGKNHGVFNPYISPNMSVSGQTALNNLKAWYQAAEVPSPTLQFRGTYIKKSESISNFSFQGSLCIFGWGINCNEQTPTPTNCYILNGNSYNLGTATGSLLTQCTITQRNVTKATNTELTNAVNGSGLQLVDVQQQGSIFYLVYGVNASVPQVIYTIDTSYHSILNPVKTQTISNGSNGTQTLVKGLMTYQF